MTTISQKLLDGASVDETAAITPLGLKHADTALFTHLIEWDADVSSGVVEVEGAHDPADAAWAPIATVTFSGSAPKTDYVNHSGPFGAIRHRISTVIGDGTVTTRVRGVS